MAHYKHGYPNPKTIEMRIVDSVTDSVGEWSSTSQALLQRLHRNEPGGGKRFLERVFGAAGDTITSMVDGVERHWRCVPTKSTTNYRNHWSKQ